MRSGSLRNVFEVQRRDETVTTTGSSLPSWTTVTTRRGSIETLSARELIAAGQAQMRATMKIRLRWVDGLTSKYRLVQSRNGRTIVYAIEEAQDVDQMHREHLLMVVATEAA